MEVLDANHELRYFYDLAKRVSCCASNSSDGLGRSDGDCCRAGRSVLAGRLSLGQNATAKTVVHAVVGPRRVGAEIPVVDGRPGDGEGSSAMNPDWHAGRRIRKRAFARLDLCPAYCVPSTVLLLPRHHDSTVNLLATTARPQEQAARVSTGSLGVSGSRSYSVRTTFRLNRLPSAASVQK